MKGTRRMFMGEDMSDENNPKYKKQYEEEVAARRRFAKAARIGRAAAKAQSFTGARRILLLVIAFGFATACFDINICRIVRYYDHRVGVASAIERQEGHMKQMMNAAHYIIPPIVYRINEKNRDKSIVSKLDSDKNNR